MLGCMLAGLQFRGMLLDGRGFCRIGAHRDVPESGLRRRCPGQTKGHGNRQESSVHNRPRELEDLFNAPRQDPDDGHARISSVQSKAVAMDPVRAGH
jgi:hypothetical protein